MVKAPLKKSPQAKSAVIKLPEAKPSANKAPEAAIIKKSQTLTKALPDDVFTPQQVKALDEAVAFINARVDRTAVSLIEIGQYLLKQFFNNDARRVSDRAPRKGISLRKLAEHPDINMSFSGLSHAVSLAVQEKQLGTVPASEQLSSSHRVLLLKVEGVEAKRQYIARIEKEKLSVRRFHDLLERDGLVQRRGLAAVADESERKMLRAGYQKFLTPLESLASLEIESVLDLPKDRIRNIYSEAKKAMSQLEKLVKRLEREIG